MLAAVPFSDDPNTITISTTPVELAIDDVVDGRYRISRRLGRGGMGTVYESQQIKLQRQVALKVLHPEFATKPLAVKRFEREAKAASSIDHRNVVKILDFGKLASGELYYTMELLEGCDLAQELRASGPLPWERAGWLTLQVARALNAIHDKGIVHRDIKPANCFLLAPKPGDDPDFVKLLDFGIANLQDQDQASALTSTSDIIGSVRYMSPEQAAAEPIDARTDIYSLGIMMYELLTGKVPFRETSMLKVMLQHKHEVPRPPRELVPKIPIEVEAIILRAIAKAPADRFQSMKELEAALLCAIEATGSHGVPRIGAPSSASMRRLQPERRWLVPLGLVLLALEVGALGATRWLGAKEAIAERAAPDVAAGEVEAVDESAPQAVAPPLGMLTDPPPEEQYDPFRDPFSAPPWHGRISLRAAIEGAPEGVPLEELLPPAPWTLEPGSIAGRLLDDHGRALATGRVCAWVYDERAPAELRRRPLCDDADHKGRFELSKVKPGYYEVVAFAPGFVPQSLLARDEQPLTLQPGEQSEALEVALVRGGMEVTGTVTTTSGEPIKAAKVAAVGSVRTLAVTDATGAFSLWVAEGELGVVAWATGYSDVVERRVTRDPLAFTLPRESVLIGKVVDPVSGLGLAGARVRAGTEGAGVDPLVYTDVDGGFRIEALSKGRYQPSARTDEGYGRAAQAVTAEEGVVPPAVVIEVRSLLQKPSAPEGLPEVPAERKEPTEQHDGAEGAAPPEAPATPPASKVRVPSDRKRLERLARSLRRCGTNGTITLSAKYVLDTGALFLPEIRVTGAAAADPKVRACAERLLNGFRLSPRRSPSDFTTLVVTLQ